MTTVPLMQPSATSTIDYIGIDVGKDDLHISRRPQNGESVKQCCEIIPNDVASIEAFLRTKGQSHYVFEATGIYSRRLEYTLSTFAYSFSKVNGLKAKSFTIATGGLKKNDRLDAVNLRVYGEKVELKVSKPLSKDQALRQRYSQALGNINKQLHNIGNQLHLLDNEAFEIEALRQSYLNIQTALNVEKDAILAFLGTVDTVEAQQGQTLLKSIVGIGDVCAKLLWEATNGFKDFDKPKQVSRFLGLVPVDDESGTIKRKRGICFTAHPAVRAALYVAAGSALQHNPFCKDLYQRLRARGKSVKISRIAVVHKLVRIAHAVVKSGTEFDLNYKKTLVEQ
jgi:transposase